MVGAGVFQTRTRGRGGWRDSGYPAESERLRCRLRRRPDPTAGSRGRWGAWGTRGAGGRTRAGRAIRPPGHGPPPLRGQGTGPWTRGVTLPDPQRHTRWGPTPLHIRSHTPSTLGAGPDMSGGETRDASHRYSQQRRGSEPRAPGAATARVGASMPACDTASAQTKDRAPPCRDGWCAASRVPTPALQAFPAPSC